MIRGGADLRVLIIDDNAQMRTIMGAVLGAAGVRTLHYAPDGRMGVRRVAEVEPDICFVDYEMPVMNGLDFVSEIRSQPAPVCFMPIVMLTGHSDAIRVNAARDRGVTEFLAKPVTAQAILGRLAAVIYRPRPFITSATYFGPDRRRNRAEPYCGPKRRAAETVNTLEL